MDMDLLVIMQEVLLRCLNSIKKLEKELTFLTLQVTLPQLLEKVSPLVLLLWSDLLCTVLSCIHATSLEA